MSAVESQEPSRVKSITIVGGGSSGWMTAMYLNKLYNHHSKSVAIRLIESPDIGIIGVGEATVHSIRFFFAALGLDEKELLRETNASLKTGILFRNWMQPSQGKTHEYFHSFEQQQLGNVVDISTAWMLNRRFETERYDEGVSISAHLIKQNHSPKTASSGNYQGVVPYGYHLDALLLGRYLRRKAVEQGVEHVQATVTDVECGEVGISKVVTDQGEFSADFFIDCTGFKSLLINKLKQNNWQSFENALPCNRAVAIQTEYPQQQTPKSYTLATAIENGWVWEIDLVNRRGTGYVYDGNRLTAEQAEQRLLEHLGHPENIIKTNHLKMRIGCLNEFWVKNCVAIGLSGGFIEPLESTGLHLINLAVRLLGTHLNSQQTEQAVRDSYNQAMQGVYQDLKQFIVLHYCLSNRRDSEFWQEAVLTAKYCEGLEQKIELWRHKICEFMDLAGGYMSIFTDENYRSVVYGMNHFPNLSMASDTEHNQKIFDQLKSLSDRAMSKTLSHEDFLRRLATH